jgi:hypothetical protein
MATHDSEQHSETQHGSLMDDERFIELSRLTVRLLPVQRYQLSDWLTDEKRKELSDDHSHTLRIFNDDD